MEQEPTIATADTGNLRQARQGRPLIDMADWQIEFTGKLLTIVCRLRLLLQLPSCRDAVGLQPSEVERAESRQLLQLSVIWRSSPIG